MIPKLSVGSGAGIGQSYTANDVNVPPLNRKGNDMFHKMVSLTESFRKGEIDRITYLVKEQQLIERITNETQKTNTQ